MSVGWESLHFAQLFLKHYRHYMKSNMLLKEYLSESTERYRSTLNVVSVSQCSTIPNDG